MNLGTVRTNVRAKLAESVAAFYTEPEINDWVNMGQAEFCLLQVAGFVRLGVQTTALLIKTAVIATTGGDWRIVPPADLVYPMRVVFGNSVLLKTTHKMLDRYDPDWENAAGNPQHWGSLGANLMFIHPRPTLTANLDLTYTYLPPTLSLDTDVPAIGAEFHYLLEEYAVYMSLMKEGQARIEAALAHYNTFLSGATKLLEPLPRRQG